MAFRLSAKSFFLTYPKCDATPQAIYDMLDTKGRIKECIISKELHADGTDHRHVYVRYSKTINVKSQNYFNIGEFHGNYQTCKNPEATKNYVKKDKDFQIFAEDNVQTSLLDQCKTLNEEEFMEYCVREKIPIGYYNECKRMCHDVFTIPVNYQTEGN